MDVQVAHAIAPDAQIVIVNARPTVEGDGAYEKIAAMFDDADRDFPGAVWSLSIGWGCDNLIRGADLAPVRAAFVNAQKHGTHDLRRQRRHGRTGMQGWRRLFVPTGTR